MLFTSLFFTLALYKYNCPRGELYEDTHVPFGKKKKKRKKKGLSSDRFCRSVSTTYESVVAEVLPFDCILLKEARIN